MTEFKKGWYGIAKDSGASVRLGTEDVDVLKDIKIRNAFEECYDSVMARHAEDMSDHELCEYIVGSAKTVSDIIVKYCIEAMRKGRLQEFINGDGDVVPNDFESIFESREILYELEYCQLNGYPFEHVKGVAYVYAESEDELMEYWR